MKKRILADRITRTEEEPLSLKDIEILSLKRNGQFRFLVFSYVPLAAICLYVLIDGLRVIYRQRNFPGGQIEETDERNATFHLVAPYFCGFLLLLLTIYFVRYYLQSLAPLLKDLKNNKKLLLHYIPEKTEMGVFNRYYLSTPIVQKQQAEINKEDFYSISNGAELAVEMAPSSNTILRFSKEGKEIEIR